MNKLYLNSPFLKYIETGSNEKWILYNSAEYCKWNEAYLTITKVHLYLNTMTLYLWGNQKIVIWYANDRFKQVLLPIRLHFTDEETTWGNKYTVLQKDFENAMSRIEEQQGIFTENCNKRDTCTVSYMLCVIHA